MSFHNALWRIIRPPIRTAYRLTLRSERVRGSLHDFVNLIKSSGFTLRTISFITNGRIRNFGQLFDILRPPPTTADFLALFSKAEKPYTPYPRRVLMVCGNLSPGGAERQLVNTAIGLQRNQNVESVTVVCDRLTSNHPSQYDFYRPLLTAEGIEAFALNELPCSYSPPELISKNLQKAIHKFPDPMLANDIFSCYCFIRKTKPEVVHAWLDWSNVRAGAAAILAGAPKIILSGRNLSPIHFDLYAPYMHPAYRAILPQQNVHFLNNSVAGARDYENWLELDAQSIGVIHNGIYIEDVRRDVGKNVYKDRLNLSSNSLIVGGMFRLNPEKRPRLWLETAAKISNLCHDVHFVVYGAGTMLNELKTLGKELGLSERLHFLGIAENAAVAMRAFDIMLLTSRAEGTPNVLLEAQAQGIPVVASAGGGTEEAVDDGKTGLVVRDSNPDVIAQAVLAVLNGDALGGDLKNAGRTFVENRFGLTRMIKETLEAYGYLETPQAGDHA